MKSRKNAPVFVVGSARSGNTLLYHMLLSSGHFPLYRTEPVVFDLLVPRFGDFGKISNRRRLMECWVRSKQARASGRDLEQLTEKVLAEVRTGGDFLRIVMDAIALSGGFGRWAVWGPDNLLYMPIIKKQIPEALFIHVIRDGRDVAYALDKKGFIRPFPWDRDRRLLVSGLHWMWKVRKGRKYGRALGSDYIEVKFEDLVTNPGETMERLSIFLDQTLDNERIRQRPVGTVNAPNSSFQEELLAGDFNPVSRWKRRLPSQQIAVLEQLIGELLTELGYSLSVSTQPRKSSRRLHVLRATYPHFFQLKEFLKLRTPLGRCVDTNRLIIRNEVRKA